MSLLRGEQFFGERLSLPSQRAGALQVSYRRRGFRLIHKLAHLPNDLLLAGTERLPGDLLQILFRREQHLIG